WSCPGTVAESACHSSNVCLSTHSHFMFQHAGTEKSVFPLPEPQDLFQAAQVKFEDITKDIRKLKRDLTACEKDVHKVCANSSEEHLQPFQEKMEGFISDQRITENEQIETELCSESCVSDYFGSKPKAGEKEVAPSHVFMLWYEFCNDFKNTWIRQNKNISKEREEQGLAASLAPSLGPITHTHTHTLT
uniref:Formin 1 n=1 Tax=Seriola lalandi dorsalis TaxID=1841481 RepID=A0A3B4WQG7_SERLL